MSLEYDLVGCELRHYRIVSLLGEGGMGAVYAAHDPNLNRRVALKVLPPDLIASRSFAGAGAPAESGLETRPPNTRRGSGL